MKYNSFRGALSGFYIYLGCLCGSHRLCHKQGEQGEHLTPHELPHDLINARIKYL